MSFSDEKEKEALNAVTNTVQAAIVGAAIFDFILNLFLQGALNKMISSIKSLLIIVHIMLIQVNLVPHAEFFLKQILLVLSFEFFDTKEMGKSSFKVSES